VFGSSKCVGIFPTIKTLKNPNKFNSLTLKKQAALSAEKSEQKN
jgi:hypothetical protein